MLGLLSLLALIMVGSGVLDFLGCITVVCYLYLRDVSVKSSECVFDISTCERFLKVLKIIWFFFILKRHPNMVMLTQGQEISLFLMKYNVKVRALRIRNLPLVLSHKNMRQRLHLAITATSIKLIVSKITPLPVVIVSCAGVIQSIFIDKRESTAGVVAGYPGAYV